MVVRFLLLLPILLLSACGFQPLYGTGSAQQSVPSTLHAVSIGNIPDRDGQRLRNLLLDRFGATEQTRYVLTVAPIQETRTELDITVEEESTRARLRLTTSITLTDTETGKEITTRSFYTLASFNILQSQFQTRVAEDNARKNGIEDLARQIEQAVVLALRDTP